MRRRCSWDSKAGTREVMWSCGHDLMRLVNPLACIKVLEEEEYLRRKDFYQDVGQRHYYFMNIGNGEVIDALRKVWAIC